MSLRAQAIAFIRNGMAQFRNCELRQSLDSFDAAARIAPEVQDELWQRGLTLFYLGDYAKAAHQFRIDVAKNPNDTEEAIWCLLSEAKMEEYGLEKARERYLKVGRDSRDVMRTVYELFAGRATEDDVLALCITSPHDQFYAHLYVGLYAEMLSDYTKARAHLQLAVDTPYNHSDYMYGLAMVHLKVRNWAF